MSFFFQKPYMIVLDLTSN